MLEAALRPIPVETAASAAGKMLPRITFLTNIIPPYHKPILQRLSQKYPGFRVFLSTPMETNRPWPLEWEGLHVTVQKTLTIQRRWRHPKGFSEPLFVHIPLDTVQQLNRVQADLVISGEMGTRTILAAIYRHIHPRSRLIVWAEMAETTEHGRGWTRRVVRHFLHRAVDAFLVTGESGHRYLVSLGIPERKLFKIAYTTDIRRFASLPLLRPAGTRTLLYVGQLIERKGLIPFLRALARWAAAHSACDIQWMLAGDGPLRRALEQFEVPRNLHLICLGNVDYQNLPGVYEASSIFVLPSLADSWAVVVNEAMAAGLPVLGSPYAQAVSELVKEGTNGWYFRPENPDEIYGAIDRALMLPEHELNLMRKSARDTALQLSPDVVTGMIDHAIVSTLQGGMARVRA
jgi:glycosyltransferase involved in cell wall biosynthesis